MTSNYRDEVPEHVNKTQQEWEELSYHAQYYYLNEERQENMRERQRERRNEKKELLSEKKSEEGCYFCGLENPVCLDFHHKNSEEKKESVSRMADKDYSVELIELEIEKCEVICANCHRKLHAGEIEL